MKHIAPKSLLVVLGLACLAGVLIYLIQTRDPYFFSRSRQYSGDLYCDWEGDVFFPNGRQETWKVIETDKQLLNHLYPEPGKKSDQSWGAASLIVEAKLSCQCRFGHMGAATHELKIIRVIHSEPVKYDFNTKHLQFRQSK